MGIITQLDTDQIDALPTFSGASGEGLKINNSLDSYSDGLINIENNGFGSEDSSTAHGVISALQDQALALDPFITDVNTLLDEAIGLIRSDIIEKEDTLSITILED
ncbi:MAG: hypothetical protein J6U23_03850 [Clostridiales bacterium]|nr:hypothetical protein [Clostridiales bacterium]